MAVTDFTDEILMAYADGRLDRETAVSVEAAARADAALRARIATFRATGDLLSRLGEARKAAPVPEALRARAEQAIVAARPAAVPEPEQPKSEAARILPFERPRQQASAKRPPRFSFIPMAMAASLALVIGLGAGLSLDDTPAGDAWFGTAALEGSGIAGVLSTLPAGQEHAIPGARVAVLASFKDGTGALCREFEIKRPGQGLVSVACHVEQGWEMRFAAATGNAPGYAPASSMEALDVFLGGVEATAPLSMEDERLALEALQ